MKKILTTMVVLGLVAVFAFSSMAVASSFGPRMMGQGMMGQGMMGQGADGEGWGQRMMSGARGCQVDGDEAACGVARGGESMMGIVAEILNMDLDQLRETNLEGKSLAEVAAEQDVAKEDLVQAIVDHKSQYWQELVDQGKFTAEQQEAAVASWQERVEIMVDQEMNFQKGSRRGCGGGRGLNNDAGKEFSGKRMSF